MDRQEATEIAKRISELWPTTTAAQIGETLKSLLAPEFTAKEAREAISSMFANGLKFFEFGELRCRVIQRVPRPDPKVVLEPHRRREVQHRQERDSIAEAWHQAETFVIDLPESKQRHYREEFLNGQNSTLRKLYTGIFEKAKLPKNFVAYVYQHETGRKVEQIIPPAGMEAPVVSRVPAMQQDPFKDEWPEFS